AYPLSGIPHNARQNALNQLKKFQSSSSPIQCQSTPIRFGGPPPPPGNLWVNIGPTPILNGQVSPLQPVSGRTTAIAVDPNDPTHWLIGGAQGGIWSSSDAGLTWTPLTDDQASL